MRKIVVFVLFFCGNFVFGQTRSFDSLFPNLSSAYREKVFSGGLIISEKTKTLRLLPYSGSGIDISSPVMRRNPSYLTESLIVVPTKRPIGFLEIYNVLGNIQGLRGRLYHSATRDEYIPLFEEATRIVSNTRTTAIPDPRPATSVPASETVFIRLRDINFGNSFYRADITASQRGLLYTLSNFRSLTYLFVPVIREDKFVAQLYFEPINEGVLIYSIAGADVSDFIASRTDIPSAIQKRLEVIIQWVVDGISS